MNTLTLTLNRKSLLTTLATLGCLSYASLALAAEPPRSIRVNYSDLNISTSAGVEALYSRLDGAARKVCAPQPSARDFVYHRAWSGCRSTALSTAVADVGSPTLAAYHESKGGTRVARTLVASTSTTRR